MACLSQAETPPSSLPQDSLQLVVVLTRFSCNTSSLSDTNPSHNCLLFLNTILCRSRYILSVCDHEQVQALGCGGLTAWQVCFRGDNLCMFLLSIVISLKGFETFVTLQLWITNKVISVTHAGLIVYYNFVIIVSWKLFLYAIIFSLYYCFHYAVFWRCHLEQVTVRSNALACLA